MAKTSILTIMIQLAKKGDADRSTIKGLAELKSNVGLAMGAFSAFAGVAVTVGAALGKATDTFTSYATQVRDISRMTGMTADETSRLIQVADDVAISYEDLQKSLWNASKKGIDINIDSVARLADEYNALGSSSEQAAFLAEKFGKSGKEMGKLLQEGGSGIESMTEAMSGGLILTDQSLQAAEAYRVQVDNLNDSWDGLLVTLGGEAVPVLTDVLDLVNRLAVSLSTPNPDGWLAGVIENSKEGEAQIDSATNSYIAYGQAAQTAAQMAAAAETDLLAQRQEMTQENQDLLSLMFNLQQETTNYTQKNDELKTKLAELYVEQSKWFEGGRKWNEYQAEIDETKSAMSQLADEHEAAGKRIAFSLLQQKMAVDGLTDAEFSSLMSIATQWGIVDEKVAESALIMNAQATAMAESYSAPNAEMTDFIDKANNLQRKSGSIFDFYVNVHTRGSFPNFDRGANSGQGSGWANNAGVDAEEDLWENKAAGGQLGAGWTMVGERGFELISPSGWVYTNEQSRDLINAGLNPSDYRMFGGAMDVQETRAVIAGQVASRRARRKSRSRGASPVRRSNSAGSGNDDAVVETVSAATDVTAEAVQSSVAVQQQATREAIETRNTIERGNNDLLAAMRENNELLRQQITTVQRSIVAAVQQASP